MLRSGGPEVTDPMGELSGYAATYYPGTTNLGEAQRALLHYFAGIRTERVEVKPQAFSCDLLLAQGRPLDEQVMTQDWKKIWEGHRPGDKDERFRLYQRTVKKQLR